MYNLLYVNSNKFKAIKHVAQIDLYKKYTNDLSKLIIKM